MMRGDEAAVYEPRQIRLWGLELGQATQGALLCNVSAT